MTGQLELWRDGWDVEPCDTSLDPGLTAYLAQLTYSDQGRAAGGRRRWVHLDKPIHEITAPKEYL